MQESELGTESEFILKSTGKCMTGIVNMDLIGGKGGVEKIDR